MNWSSKTWGVHWHCSSFGRRNSCLSDELCSPFGPTISWAERLRLCVGHLPKPAASMKRIPSQYCETMPDCFLGECFTKSLSLFQRLNMSKPFRPWIRPLRVFFVWRIGFWLLFLRLLEWCGFFGFQAFCRFRLLWLPCCFFLIIIIIFLLSIVFVSFLWFLGFLWP